MSDAAADIEARTRLMDTALDLVFEALAAVDPDTPPDVALELVEGIVAAKARLLGCDEMYRDGDGDHPGR